MNQFQARNEKIIQASRGGIIAPLELARMCGGYYDCPKKVDGKRSGPLVGYAGRDGQGRQYVGDTYVNFAAVERIGVALKAVAMGFHRTVIVPRERCGMSFDTYCGAPEGGKTLGTVLANRGDKNYIYPEKKVIEIGTATSREKSRLVFSRHEPEPGERIIIVEDVCNNFSTTSDLVRQIHSFGAQCVAVACFLNRSPVQRSEITVELGESGKISIPVISLVNMPIPQYKQDDPAVVEDVLSGNIVWKPKDEWTRLASTMAS